MFEDDEEDTATTLYRSNTERSTTSNRSLGGCDCGCDWCGLCVAPLSAAADDVVDNDGLGAEEGTGTGEEVVWCGEGHGAGWCVDTALSSLAPCLLRGMVRPWTRKVAWLDTDRFSLLLLPPSFAVYVGAFFLNSTTSLTCRTPQHQHITE